VGPRAGLDKEDSGKILCLCRASNFDRQVVQPAARHCRLMTELLTSKLVDLCQNIAVTTWAGNIHNHCTPSTIPQVKCTTARVMCCFTDFLIDLFCCAKETSWERHFREAVRLATKRKPAFCRYLRASVCVRPHWRRVRSTVEIWNSYLLTPQLPIIVV